MLKFTQEYKVIQKKKTLFYALRISVCGGEWEEEEYTLPDVFKAQNDVPKYQT